MSVSEKTSQRSRKPAPRREYQRVVTRSFNSLLRELDRLVPLVEQAQVLTAQARDAVNEVAPENYQTGLRRDRTLRFLSSVLRHGDLLRNSAQLYRAELEMLAKAKK